MAAPQIHARPALPVGKTGCPRCGGRCLDPHTLRCICGAEFTQAGLAHWRALPSSQALRT